MRSSWTNCRSSEIWLLAACAKLLTNDKCICIQSGPRCIHQCVQRGFRGRCKAGPLVHPEACRRPRTETVVVWEIQRILRSIPGFVRAHASTLPVLGGTRCCEALCPGSGEPHACVPEVLPASELSLLKPGKATRGLGSEAPRMIECLDLAGAIEDACGKDGFMASELAVADCTVACLLGQEDVATLCQQVEALQDTANKDLDSIPALQRFFLQHDTGKAFFSIAQLRVEQGDKERVFQEKLATLRKTMSHLTAWPKQSPPDAESAVMAVEKRVVPAVDALAEVKRQPFFPRLQKAEET